MFCPTVIPISDRSLIGEARRATVRKCATAQFSETDQGRAAIIATELATNLLHHAQNGRLIVQVVPTADGLAVDFLSIDSGPGIANVDKSLRDGFSTAGTSGNGLGAVRRLSSEFDVFSQLQCGTIVFARLLASKQVMSDPGVALADPSSRDLDPAAPVWGGISIPVRGEDVCGDTWRVGSRGDQLAIMVADGLGHGPLAEEASSKAAETFGSEPTALPGVFLRKAHQSLAGTRGAAIAMARVDLRERLVKYAGIGNISGSLFCGMDGRGMFSHNGIVGVQMRSVQDFDYPIPGPGLLIMHSDGLQTRWNVDSYPGLVLRHPMVIAGVLLRDFARGRDDVTVVVARWNSFKV